MGKVPKMLGRAGLSRKQILHWSKEKKTLSDNIWWEGGTGIGEQVLFVARELGGIEQEREKPESGARIENGFKIVKNMWG